MFLDLLEGIICRKVGNGVARPARAFYLRVEKLHKSICTKLSYTMEVRCQDDRRINKGKDEYGT